MIEALDWGLPFVATPMAFRGMPLPENGSFPLTEDPSAFADHVFRLLESDDACHQLIKVAADYMKDIREKCLRTLQQVVYS